MCAEAETDYEGFRARRAREQLSWSKPNVTYRELLQKVCRLANGVQSLGVKKSDRVVIYMAMSIEGIGAMQAYGRIGRLER